MRWRWCETDQLDDGLHVFPIEVDEAATTRCERYVVVGARLEEEMARLRHDTGSVQTTKHQRTATNSSIEPGDTGQYNVKLCSLINIYFIPPCSVLCSFVDLSCKYTRSVFLISERQ